MSELRYRYAEQNRLEHRYHYHYTPFEGSEFLDAYRASRLGWVARLSDQLSIPAKQIESIRFVASRIQSPTGTVESARELLGDILRQAPSSNDASRAEADSSDEWRPLHWSVQHLRKRLEGTDADQSDRNLLDRLVQRFEVTKRIYGSYNEQNKPVDRRFDDPHSYAILAVVCLDEYLTRANLKYLNVALKLIDLLASLPSDRITMTIAPVCVFLAHLELGCLDTMIREHEAA